MTISLAGDIHFEGALSSRLARPATALSSTRPQLATADLAIANLETSIGAGGRPEPGKRYVFQAPPAAFQALAAAGIDVVTMANNHAMDYGRAPLAGTFEAIDDAAQARPPLRVVGVGRDLTDAFRPARVKVRGVVVSVIGATVADLDPTADPTSQWAATDSRAGTADAIRHRARLLRAVARSVRTSDVVVVYMHWGVQGTRCPTDDQRSLAVRLVRAGADIVAGSHAHLLQGAGRLGTGYVAYGLGNYVWYTPTPAGDFTGVLTLTVRPGAARTVVSGARWDPARIGSDGLPEPLGKAAATEFETALTSLRTCAGLESGR